MELLLLVSIVTRDGPAVSPAIIDSTECFRVLFDARISDDHVGPDSEASSIESFCFESADCGSGVGPVTVLLVELVRVLAARFFLLLAVLSEAFVLVPVGFVVEV